MAIAWAPLANVTGRPFGRQRDIRGGEDAARVFAYEGPGVAVLDSEDGDAVILHWWTIDGDFFGDVWYPSIQVAKEVAVEMWGDDLGEWRSVPESVADSAIYVLEAARAALNP